MNTNSDESWCDANTITRVPAEGKKGSHNPSKKPDQVFGNHSLFSTLLAISTTAVGVNACSGYARCVNPRNEAME